MGMFDDVRCLYPLGIDGSESFEWQTKDTPGQFLEKWVVKPDGTLWHDGTRFELVKRAHWFGGEMEIHTLRGHFWYSVVLTFESGRLKSFEILDNAHRCGLGYARPKSDARAHREWA